MAADKDILNFFAKFIEAQTGIAYSEVTFYQLESRLEAIAVQLGHGTIPKLAEIAQKSGIQGPMKELLIDVATNNETSFFRDTKLFTTLAQEVLPAMMQAHSGRSFRIWSAASSTGQEVYSLAMILSELQSQYPEARWEMVASDISERVLAKASSGRYTQLEIQRGLNAQRLLSYFDQIEDEGNGAIWKIKPHLQQKITFRRLNLIEPWPASLGKFDLILCRNVLIYQTVEQKKRVLQQIAQRLNPGCRLILGGAESLIGLSEDYDQEQISGSIFYRLKSPTPMIQAS